jgi:Mlc titration factor MtfA (ptsG expression regulator)
MRASLFRFWYRRFPPRLKESDRQHLHHYSVYYRGLNQSEKRRFEHRLAVTLRWLRFRTDRIPEVKPEMPIVVGAGITQVSFGLQRYLFRRFRKILIVPDVYTYPGMEHMRFLGDTNRMNWVISLSWPHVLEGFRDPNDSFNVVIHEIAHGLEWEHILGRQRVSAFFRHQDFQMWRRMAAKKLQVIRNGENQFLKNTVVPIWESYLP